MHCAIDVEKRIPHTRVYVATEEENSPLTRRKHQQNQNLSVNEQTSAITDWEFEKTEQKYFL